MGVRLLPTSGHGRSVSEDIFLVHYNNHCKVLVFMDEEWYCGGTIISDDYIMTAAHCVADHTQFDIVGQYVNMANSTQNPES